MKPVILKIIAAAAVVLSFGLTTATLEARDYGLGKTAEVAELPTKVAGSTDAASLIGSFVKIALDLTGIVFFGLILYAGFRWMTARDNSTMIDKSKDTIEHAVVGLIIVIAAYAITNFVFSNLSANGAAQQQQPMQTQSQPLYQFNEQILEPQQ